MSRAQLLRHRGLRALLSAEVISTTGAQMTWLALPWFVLTTTGSASRMGVVMGAELVGVALAGIPSGAVLERLGSRRSMLVADAVRAPLMTLVPVLHWTGHLSFGTLVAVALALGALAGPYFAAQRIIVPELLGEDEVVVGQANALFQGAIRVTMLLGPPIAGVLIGWIGATSVLLVDATTYAVSFVLVAVFVPSTRPRHGAEEERHGLLAGLRFLTREPLLRAWTPLFTIGDTAFQAFFAAVPVLVIARFGSDPRVAGILFAAWGTGAVAGNLVAFRWLLERVDGLRLIRMCCLGQALPLWLLGLDLPAAVLACAVAASGLANGLVNPSIHSIITLRIPPALRAKTTTAFMTVFGLVTPLGLVVAGPTLDAVGAQPVLVGVAAVQTVTMAGVALASARASAARAAVAAPAES
jgi:MFS family permease